MTDEEFWEHIGLLNWDRTGDDDAVIEPVVSALIKKDIQQIFEFEEILRKLLYALDTKQHGKRAKLACFSNYISADYFLYWRCAVVANGKDIYERTLKKPRQFPKKLDFEPLLSIASKAYELKTNSEWEYLANISYETYSNKIGWQ